MTRFRPKTLFLLLSPVLIFLILTLGSYVRGPYYLANNQDPAYLYLLNSLNVANLIPAGHTDHPGSAVQLVGAIVLRMIHFLTFQGSFSEQVLIHSEFYLKCLHLLFIGVTSVSVFFLGYFIYLRSEKIIQAILLQSLLILIIPGFFETLSRFSAESMLFSIGILFLATLFMSIIKHKKKKKSEKQLEWIKYFFGIATFLSIFFCIWHLFLLKSPFFQLLKQYLSVFPIMGIVLLLVFVLLYWGFYKSLFAKCVFIFSNKSSSVSIEKKRFKIVFNQITFLFALSCAFGITTKITFFPLLIIPFLILENKEKLFWAGTFILLCFFFTVPAFPYWGFVDFTTNLFVHSGQYGAGEATIINFSSYFSNIIGIFYKSPIILLCFILEVFLLLKMSLDKKIVLAITCAQIVGLLMVAKHNYGTHYLMPTALLALPLIYLAFKNLPPFKLFFNEYKPIVFLTGVVLLIISFQFLFFVRETSILTANEIQRLNKFKESNPDSLWIYGYPASSHCYALFFGNGYAFSSYNTQLKKIYPDALFFVAWGNNPSGYSTWDNEVNLTQIKKSNFKNIFIHGSLDRFVGSKQFKIVERLPLNDNIYVFAR